MVITQEELNMKGLHAILAVVITIGGVDVHGMVTTDLMTLRNERKIQRYALRCYNMAVEHNLELLDKAEDVAEGMSEMGGPPLTGSDRRIVMGLYIAAHTPGAPGVDMDEEASLPAGIDLECATEEQTNRCCG
ncbi:MAG: hypothetical protein LBR78_01965 [Holosporales bacterium]|nr:hypothetical protein [Holosporales bacterium]